IVCLALGFWVYVATGSIQRTFYCIVPLVTFFLVLDVAMRVGRWLFDSVSPNAIGKLDHRSQPANLRPFRWDQLQLKLIERVLLRQWLEDHPSPRLLRYVPLFVVAAWIALSMTIDKWLPIRDQYARWAVMIAIAVPLLVVWRRTMERQNL